ncbi:hypothetical protein Pan153_21760 [Gimesia panareensis]|uniref:Uncharacterized protein n=1 Tax=Gimesia panareensis TaxID=2527978 RepID=A0A518FME4_9PLAN|nr:hypothetical protein [Gimesia panareensis]QDV17523.1 hypothetical protein Pan153_21760 [Gimesia panareensis]
MKPVTVITGAIAISLGSVLLTGSGGVHNNSEILNEDQTTFTGKTWMPPEKNSQFLNSGDNPGKVTTHRNDSESGETKHLVWHSQNDKLR